MALDKILTDGSETGESSAQKINTAFGEVDKLILGSGAMTMTVYNNTGAVIPQKRAVRYNDGDTLGYPNVIMAQGDNILNAKVMGITTQNILPNQTGEVITYGLLSGVNTLAYGAGKYLYLSETEAGIITTDSPNGIISTLGITLISATDGQIAVGITNFRSLPIAYASMKGGSSGNTLDSTWQDIANFTSQNDVIMESIPLTGEISCKISGSYDITANLNLTFETSGQGQSRTTLYLRMVGDDGYISDSIPLGLQNSSITGSFTPSFMSHMVGGVNYRMQISSDRSLTGVVYTYVSAKVEAKHLELDI